jgi:hypothetical protein
VRVIPTLSETIMGLSHDLMHPAGRSSHPAYRKLAHTSQRVVLNATS